MARVRVNSEGVHTSQHLPPLDASALLRVDASGRVRATELLDMPLTEHGIPDPAGYLELLSGTLSAEYEPPATTNVHHLAYPKADYRQEGRDGVPGLFRDSPSLMVSIPVQLHTYGHWIMRHPPQPSRAVMEQWVREQQQVDQLYSLGQAAISATRWLDSLRGEGAMHRRTAERYLAERAVSQGMFLDYLDKCQDAQVGLMPSREGLAAKSLRGATRELGKLSTGRVQVLHRQARTTIRTSGL